MVTASAHRDLTRREIADIFARRWGAVTECAAYCEVRLTQVSRFLTHPKMRHARIEAKIQEFALKLAAELHLAPDDIYTQDCFRRSAGMADCGAPVSFAIRIKKAS